MLLLNRIFDTARHNHVERGEGRAACNYFYYSISWCIFLFVRISFFRCLDFSRERERDSNNKKKLEAHTIITPQWKPFLYDGKHNINQTSNVIIINHHHRLSSDEETDETPPASHCLYLIQQLLYFFGLVNLPPASS